MLTLGKSSGKDGEASLRALEFKRTTTTLSLQEEKGLLQKIERIKRDRKLEEDLHALRELHNDLYAKLVENKKHLDAVLNEEKTFHLAAEISKRKGGVPIDPRQLVTVTMMIPQAKIGQFLGKQRGNLNKFQKTYCVGVEVENSGQVTLKGLAEDVDAAKQAVDDFNNEVSKQMRVTAGELKMLKRNHAAHMRTIETLMQVSITIVPSSFNASKASSAATAKSSASSASSASEASPKSQPQEVAEIDGSISEVPIEKTAATLVVRGLLRNVLEACRAVRELAAFTGTFPFKSSSASVRALLDNNAAALKELEESLSVAIEIDRAMNELRIIGSNTQVTQAQQKLEAFFEVHEQVSVEVPFDHDASEILSCIVGKGGAIVKRLQAETGASITVVRNDKSEGGASTSIKPFVRISAPKDKLDGAKAAVHALIEKYFRENVALTFDGLHFSTVTAARADLLKDIEGEVNLSVVRSGNSSPVSSPSSSSAPTNRVVEFTVYLRGEESGVQEVAKRVNDLIAAQTSQIFRFPKEATSTIIGSKGATITKIQKDSGASISVDDGVATVRGDSEQVAKAVECLGVIVTKYEDENTKFFIHPSILGTLIGKSGATLNKIREDSGASVDVNTGASKDKEKDQNRAKDRYGFIVRAPLVRIRGEKEKLMKAKELVEALLKENGTDPLPEEEVDCFREVVVPIPSEESTRKLLGHQGSTVKKLESSFKVHINIERKAQRVVLTGTASEQLLQCAENVRDLLEQGKNTVVRAISVLICLVHPGVFCSEDVPVNGRLSTLLNEEAIKKLQDDSGASLVVANGKARVSGAASSVRLAKEWMQDLVRGVARDVLKLMPAQAQALADKRTTLDRLVTQSGDVHASIEINTAKSLARLKGVEKKGTLDKLKAELLQLLTFFYPENVVVEKLPSLAAVPSLIGRKGAVIRKIQVDWDVIVIIVRSAKAVYLNGDDNDKLQEAQKEVRRILDEWSKGNVEIKGTQRTSVIVIGIPECELTCVIVLGEAIPSLIGKKGAKIKQLQADSGADAIDVDKVRNLVRIRGSPEATSKAKELVQQCVEQYLKENTVIEIDPEDIPLLIGPRGATINAIQEQTRAQIRINKRDNTVAINGEEDHIVAAKDKITEMIQRAKEEREQKRQLEEEKRQKIREEQRQKPRQGSPADAQSHTENVEPQDTIGGQYSDRDKYDANGLEEHEQPETTVGTAIEMDTSSYMHRKRASPAPVNATSEPESTPAQVNEIVGLLNSATIEQPTPTPKANGSLSSSRPNASRKVNVAGLTPPPGFEARPEIPPPGFQAREEEPAESTTYYKGTGYSLRLD